jgi:ubiquitin-protein ligase
MDPVGAALGIAGLLGLFSAAVEVVDLVELGRAYAKDYEIIQTKFEIQKIRLLTWGKSVGLLDGEHYDTRLDSPIIRPTVERVLNNIKALLSDERRISRQYGLRPDTGGSTFSGPVVFRESYRRFQERLLQTQKATGIIAKTKWAIADKKKFDKLISDLKELLDGLNEILQSLKLVERQTEMITMEVESILDSISLELLAEVADDRISDTASRRIKLLSDTQGGRTRASIVSKLASMSITDTFHTATSQLTDERDSTGPRMEELRNEQILASIPQNQRVMQELRNRISGTASEEAVLHVSIAVKAVGKALSSLKVQDSRHNEVIIDKFAQSTNPDQKRMVMILENFQKSDPTSFVSLTTVEDNLLHLIGRVEGPQSTPYEGGVFHVEIKIPEDFPWAPPSYRFLTRVYHPNIDAQGNICLDLLDPKHWRMDFIYIEPILISICALLDKPNLDDPLVLEIATQYLEDRATFNKIASDYTKRFANPTAPALLTADNGIGNKGQTWRDKFLFERSNQMQQRIHLMIKVLSSPMTKVSILDTEQVQSYIQLLHQLAGELVSADDTMKSSRKLNSFDHSILEPWENIWDLCCQEFRSLSFDRKWTEAFPTLPNFGNDSTQGNGSAFIHFFSDAASSSQVAIHVNCRDDDRKFNIDPVKDHVRGLTSIVNEAKWLNGDESLKPKIGFKTPFSGVYPYAAPHLESYNYQGNQATYLRRKE